MIEILEQCLVLDAYGMQPALRKVQNTAGKTGSISVRWGDAASITILADMNTETLRLRYTVDGVQRDIPCPLRRVYSNMIPNTYHWQFGCPQTGRTCAKLYLHDGIFTSRYAIPNARYKQQTQSRKQRTDQIVLLLHLMKLDDSEYPSTKSKRHYRQKDTRRHMRWCRKAGRAQKRYSRSK